jgi:hypothetical protein
MLSAEKDTNRIQNSQTSYRWAFQAGWFDILLISYKLVWQEHATNFSLAAVAISV